MNKKNLVGKRFGKLVVLKELPIRNEYGRVIWECLCDCGKKFNTSTPNLVSKRTNSCGCLKGENAKTHGLTRTKIYKEYYHIKKRCYNKNSDRYKWYGGRGITMCEDWKNNFMNFYNWAMSNGYKEDLTIERIDFNGNYEPKNCKWIPMSEQAKNRRGNVFYKGKCIAEWLRELKVEKKKEWQIYKNIRKYGAEQIIKSLIGEE